MRIFESRFMPTSDICVGMLPVQASTHRHYLQVLQVLPFILRYDTCICYSVLTCISTYRMGNYAYLSVTSE